MADATVCLSYDFDAVSSWIHVPERRSPTNVSRGLFGAEVATPRLLELLAEYDVPTTWFVPGHTIDSFPEVCGDILDGGHEIQHHGWSHRRSSDFESEAAEREDFERGIESIVDLTGERPIGYRSPSWDFSEHTLDIILDLGFEWDSSEMARDFEPYYLRRDYHAVPGDPYDPGAPTDVVEMPVSWQRDDFPPFVFLGDRGYADEGAIFENWRLQFDWMYENVDGGVFILTMHPQVIGHAHRVARLENLIEHIRGKPGVEFAQMSTAVDAFETG